MRKFIFVIFSLFIFGVPAFALHPKDNFDTFLPTLKAEETIKKPQVNINNSTQQYNQAQYQAQNNQVNNTADKINAINNTIKPFIKGY